MQVGDPVTITNRGSSYYLCEGKVLRVASQGPVPVKVKLTRLNENFKNVGLVNRVVPFRKDELFVSS